MKKAKHKAYVITPRFGERLPGTDLRIIEVIDTPEEKKVTLRWGKLRVHVIRGAWARQVKTCSGESINVFIPDPTENDEIKIQTTDGSLFQKTDLDTRLFGPRYQKVS